MKPRERTISKIKKIVEESDMLLSSKAIGKRAGIIHPYVKEALNVLLKRGDIVTLESSACVLYKKK